MTLRRSAFAAAIVGALAACGLHGAVKDSCNVDGDCNPGHVCVNGTCGPPGLPSPDAGIGDAGLEAAVEGGDAPAPHFCATAPKSPKLVVCSDFDEEGGAAEKGWDNIVDGMDLGIVGMGNLKEVSTLSFSPPNSVQFSLPPLIGSSFAAGASLIKLLDSTPESLEIQLQFYIATVQIPNQPGSGYAALVFVSFLPGGSITIDLESQGMAMLLATGMTDAGTAASQTTYPFSKDASLEFGAWMSLEIEIANAPFNGSPNGQININLNQIPAVVVALPASFQVGGRQEIAIGPLGTGPLNTLEVNMDNILIQQ